MSEPTRPRQPLDDDELAARIAGALAREAATPFEPARFAAGVRERLAAPRRFRWRPLALVGAVGAAAAAIFAVALSVTQRAAAPTEAALAVDSSIAEDSWQEQVLYAPEWIDRRAGFVDADVLPESYAVAAALLEP